MTNARDRYLTVLRAHRLNFAAPGGEEHWSPELETARPERIREIQSEKLAAAVRYLYECSRFYREKFDRAKLAPSDIKSLEDAWKLPFTTKQELVEDASAAPPWGTYSPVPDDRWTSHGWAVFGTGGTTAAPRLFRFTVLDREMFRWLFARGFFAMGVRPGDVGTLVSNYPPHMFFWGAHEGLNHMGVPMIAMGGFDLRRRINFLQMLSPTVLATTASYALHMGGTMRELGLDPATSSVRLIASGGEPGASIPSTKRRVEEMWNARLVDWFGATEFGPAAYTCRPQGGRTDGAPEIHFMEDCYLVEVVDPRSLEPVPDGQPGMLVVTGLATEGVPTLRYVVGDIVTLSRTPCPCGRTGARAVGGIQGRVDDMLSVFGIHVYPAALDDVIRGVPELSEAYEIVIEREGNTDRVTVVAEPRRDLPRAELGALAARVEGEVRSQLELRVRVDLRPYGSLPRDFKVRRIRDLRPAPR